MFMIFVDMPSLFTAKHWLGDWTYAYVYVCCLSDVNSIYLFIYFFIYFHCKKRCVFIFIYLFIYGAQR